MMLSRNIWSNFYILFLIMTEVCTLGETGFLTGCG